MKRLASVLLFLGAACSGDDAPEPPTIERFAAAPMIVAPGEDVRLSWAASNAERIEIRTGTTSVFATVEPEGATMVRALQEDTVFTLEASAEEASAFRTLKVSILRGPPPAISRFDVAPETIAPTETATLTWETVNAMEVRISIEGGETLRENAGQSGRLFVQPDETTTYVIDATSRGGTARETVTLEVDDPRPDISSFTADPEVINIGASSSLSWSVVDADEVTIVAGGMEILRTARNSGSFEVMPMLTTEYELSAVNGFGTAIARATVRVDIPQPPQIQRFEAFPNPIALGQSTSLSWNATEAETVRVFEEGNQIAEQSVEQGTLSVTPAQAEVRYRLEAENGLGTDTATVVVYAHPAPIIDTFEVTPGMVAGSATVTASWSVRNVTDLTIAANQAVIALTVSSSAAVDDTSGLPVFITGTTFFELTASSAGGSVSAEALVVAGIVESEPNDNAGSADALAGPDAVGTIDGVGDVDWYSFVVPPDGNVYAETTDRTGLCTQSDTVVTLYAPDGSTVIAVDDDSGPGDCSRIDPNVDGAAANLPGGTYYVSVTGIAGQYALTVRATGPGCGNGLLEGTELCDDGNLLPADGCSPTCEREGIEEDEPAGNDTPGAPGVLVADADRRFYGTIAPIGDRDVYGVTIPDGYHLEAFVTVGSLTNCPADPRAALTLIAPNGMSELATNEDGGPDGNCGRIAIDTTPEAFGMAGGTYFLRVNEVGDDAEIPIYFLHLRIIAPGCGNGLVEPTETCDDNNQTAGDGCDAVCQYEVGPTLTPPGMTVMLPVAGTDAFAIARVEITSAGQSIDAVAADPGGGTCSGVDTALELRDDAFVLLGRKVDGGPGTCASLVPGADRFSSDLPVGTYHLFVVSESGSGNVELDVTIINPGCGNGIREAQVGELCDDGNLMSGDGCSSGCLLEGSSGTEMEPNDTQALSNATALIGLGTFTVTGANNPSGDDDVYSLVVPAGQTLRFSARTYSTPGQPSSCDINLTDTRIFLEQAGVEATGPGTGELAYNDDRDPAANIWCSEIGNVLLGSGTYYVRVQGWNDTQITQYLLDVTLAP